MEIQHIVEASNAQKTVHDSANSKGAMTDIFSDPRVSIDRGCDASSLLNHARPYEWRWTSESLYGDFP